MNKERKDDFKDILWGIFWIGMIIGPAIYTALAKKRDGKLYAA
jgi:hypothetical protein